MSHTKPGRHYPLISGMLVFCLCFTAGCNSQDAEPGKGQIKGHIAAPAQSAPKTTLAKLKKNKNTPLNLEEIVVNLRAYSPEAEDNPDENQDQNQDDNPAPPPNRASTDPKDWPVIQTKNANRDGTFTFDEVEPGYYALDLEQKEFDNVYYVDSTEFFLGEDETVNLILPILTTIYTGGHHEYGNTILQEDTGHVYSTGNKGVTLFNLQTSTSHTVHSEVMFESCQEKGPFPIILPKKEALILVSCDRVMNLDLSLFPDSETSSIFDYDDLEFRQQHLDAINFRLIPTDLRYQIAYHLGTSFQTYLSPDEGLIYLTIDNSKTIVIDTESLEITRLIPSPCAGYNPVANHLYFTDDPVEATEILIVDATTCTDLAYAPLEGNNFYGITPMPDSEEFMVVTGKQNVDNFWISFITIFDGEGEVVRESRGKDYLGLPHEPMPDTPSFDDTNEYFMLGSNAFHILPDNKFEPVTMVIGPGETFATRIMCNERRLVDPINRYELWHGCPVPNVPMALFSLDQNNIPIGIRTSNVNSDPILDWRRGRIIFVNKNNVEIIHYADPLAKNRSAIVDISNQTADFYAPGAVCNQDTPCEEYEICVPNTDTSLSGRCQPNRRSPYLTYCGGLTKVACDPGFKCNLHNTTNPNSLGGCEGKPRRDFSLGGIICSESEPCPTGLTCIDGRCHTRSCISDEDCSSEEVCGSIPYLGKVCLEPGSLPPGALCFDSSECTTGSCVADIIQLKDSADWYYFNDEINTDHHQDPQHMDSRWFCRETCWDDGDCDGEHTCISWSMNNTPHFPHCLPAYHYREICDQCEELSYCSNQSCFCNATLHMGAPQCQVGLQYPQSLCNQGQPQCENACSPLSSSNIEYDPACTLPCLRNKDCPWQADCINGYCQRSLNPPGGIDHPRPCRDGEGCSPNESCSDLNTHHQKHDYFCLEMDSCNSSNDCEEHEECIGVCTTTCTKNCDCGDDQECVKRSYLDGKSLYHCMSPLCNCQGEEREAQVCEIDTGKCLTNLPEP